MNAKSLLFQRYIFRRYNKNHQESSDGRVVRASASAAVDRGLIPSLVIPVTLKLPFTVSLLDAQHYRDSVESKPASLLVVSLEKTLCGIPPS